MLPHVVMPICCDLLCCEIIAWSLQTRSPKYFLLVSLHALWTLPVNVTGTVFVHTDRGCSHTDCGCSKTEPTAFGHKVRETRCGCRCCWPREKRTLVEVMVCGLPDRQQNPRCSRSLRKRSATGLGAKWRAHTHRCSLWKEPAHMKHALNMR